MEPLFRLSIFLERAGHEVTVARDGIHALAALERFQPSVAVIDIDMPVMDGYELARRVLEHRDGKRIFLVALTGYGQLTGREGRRTLDFDIDRSVLVDGEAGDDLARSP